MKRKEYPKLDLFGGSISAMLKGKICKKCGVFKALKFFYRSSSSKDGYRGACKSCEKEQHREIHSRPHEIAPFKRCACCGNEYDASFFSKDPTQTDGLHSHCKSCMKESRIHNKTTHMIVKPKSRRRFTDG